MIKLPMQFRQSKPFVYKTVQTIEKPLAHIFPFFSQAENLEKLTPSWLNFEIITPLPIEMEAGTRIEYRLRLLGIPIYWQTEITVWEPPYCFVDEQIKGPYKLWRHEHHFAEENEQTYMRDIVHYDFFGSFLRYPLKHYFVEPQIRKIFDFRSIKINHLFNESKKIVTENVKST